jgi:hypothetical protein
LGRPLQICLSENTRLVTQWTQPDGDGDGDAVENVA